MWRCGVILVVCVLVTSGLWAGELSGVTIPDSVTVNDTILKLNGKEVGVIESEDFGAALLRVWLGDHPPADDLKAGMLGN